MNFREHLMNDLTGMLITENFEDRDKFVDTLTDYVNDLIDWKIDSFTRKEDLGTESKLEEIYVGLKKEVFVTAKDKIIVTIEKDGLKIEKVYRVLTSGTSLWWFADEDGVLYGGEPLSSRDWFSVGLNGIKNYFGASDVRKL